MYNQNTKEDRFLKVMKNSPLSKMDWLRVMNDFVSKYSYPKMQRARRKWRETRARMSSRAESV